MSTRSGSSVRSNSSASGSKRTRPPLAQNQSTSPSPVTSQKTIQKPFVPSDASSSDSSYTRPRTSNRKTSLEVGSTSSGSKRDKGKLPSTGYESSSSTVSSNGHSRKQPISTQKLDSSKAKTTRSSERFHDIKREHEGLSSRHSGQASIHIPEVAIHFDTSVIENKSLGPDILGPFQDLTAAHNEIGIASNRLLDAISMIMGTSLNQLKTIDTQKDLIKANETKITEKDEEAEKATATIKKLEDELGVLKTLNNELLEEQDNRNQVLESLQSDLDSLKESAIAKSEPSPWSQSTENIYSVLGGSAEEDEDEKPDTANEELNTAIADLEKKLQSKADSASFFKKQSTEAQAKVQKAMTLRDSWQKKAESAELKLGVADTTIKAIMKLCHDMQVSAKNLAPIASLLSGTIVASLAPKETLESGLEAEYQSDVEEMRRTCTYLAEIVLLLQSVKDSTADDLHEEELKNKLAAKEEAVQYLKGREKELQGTIDSQRSALTISAHELKTCQEELSKVKENYLAHLKKKPTNIQSNIKSPSPDDSSPKPLVKNDKEATELEKSLQRENLILRRDNRKTRQVAGKLLYKNPISESKHKRSKEREDNMAIVRIVPGSIAPSAIESSATKLSQLLMSLGPVSTSSIKVISSDIAIIRTPEPFHNMPSYSLNAFGVSKDMSFVHISSWYQLIVHDVPFDKSLKTIHDLVVWLFQTLPYTSVSGMYANTLACYPRMVNPLEFFSGKGKASFILCYSSREVFNSALRHGITLLGTTRPMRTEPVLGYMKNPFNQAGFVIQFEPFSEIYGYTGPRNTFDDKKTNSQSSPLSRGSAGDPAITMLGTTRESASIKV